MSSHGLGVWFFVRQYIQFVLIWWRIDPNYVHEWIYRSIHRMKVRKIHICAVGYIVVHTETTVVANPLFQYSNYTNMNLVV